MYVGWRDLLHAKGRFALMAGVVMLIAVLVGLLSGLTRGLSEESTSAITGLRTSHLVFSGEEPDFTSSRVPASAGIGGEPVGIATGRVLVGGRVTTVTLMGVRPSSAVAPDSRGVDSGRVVVSEAVARELDTAAGEELRVGSTTFTVAAVRGEASYSHMPVTWMSLHDWQEVTGADTAATVIATDSGTAPEGYTSVGLDDALTGIGSYSSENGALQLIRGFLFAISALVVGAFFTVWTVQRSRDIAVLKALGAPTGRLLRDAIGQAAVLLLGGVLVGAVIVLAARPLAQGAVPFVLEPGTVGLPLLALVVLGLAGAALAVRRVTTVDPLTALGAAR